MKNLSLAEDHFADHFPGFPVMPAPLILEGLAQTGGILVGEANDFREEGRPGQDATAKFHREAMAGEQLIYDDHDPRPERAIGARATATLPASDLVAEAEIFFAHLDPANCRPAFRTPTSSSAASSTYLLEHGRSRGSDERIEPRTPAGDRSPAVTLLESAVDRSAGRPPVIPAARRRSSRATAGG